MSKNVLTPTPEAIALDAATAANLAATQAKVDALAATGLTGNALILALASTPGIAALLATGLANGTLKATEGLARLIAGDSVGVSSLRDVVAGKKGATLARYTYRELRVRGG